LCRVFLPSFGTAYTYEGSFLDADRNPEAVVEGTEGVPEEDLISEEKRHVDAHVTPLPPIIVVGREHEFLQFSDDKRDVLEKIIRISIRIMTP
jgi:hypothetical protein